MGEAATQQLDSTPRLPSAMELKSRHPELFALSDTRGFALILMDWLQIAGLTAVGVYLDHWYTTVAIVLLIGFKQFVIAESTVHLASHYTLFRNRALNKKMEFFFAIPFIQSVEEYRTQHFLHHRIVTTETDPIYEMYDLLGLNSSKINPYWTLLVKPFLGKLAFLHAFVWIPNWFQKCSPKQKLQIVAFYAGAVGLFLALGRIDIFLIYWMIPFLFIQNQLTIINEVAEHYRCVGPGRQRIGWMNLFNHNEGYHFLHHAYPAIPWFRLKEAQRVLEPYLGEVETCEGFILKTVARINRQMHVPYIQNYQNPGRQAR